MGRLPRSGRIAPRDPALEHLWILYPGTDAPALDERLWVLPLREVQGLVSYRGGGFGVGETQFQGWRSPGVWRDMPAWVYPLR